MKKLAIIDILIVIGIIFAISFAVFHMTSNNDTGTSMSFDSSTSNKIVENYLNLYKDGYIITSKIVGINSSSGEEISIKGRVLWIDEDNSANVKVLIENNGKKYLAGLYKDVPEADIYIKQISLETTGEKYKNLKEITLKPKSIKTIDDLTSILDNKTEYEISTNIAISDITTEKCQKLNNKLNEIKEPKIIITTNPYNLIKIERANHETMKIANSILGNINGETSTITIRIYNCSIEDINSINKTSNLVNIKNIN